MYHILLVMTNKLLRLCCYYCNHFKYIQIALTRTFNIQITLTVMEESAEERGKISSLINDDYVLSHSLNITVDAGPHVQQLLMILTRNCVLSLLKIILSIQISSGPFNLTGMTRRSFPPPESGQ